MSLSAPSLSKLLLLAMTSFYHTDSRQIQGPNHHIAGKAWAATQSKLHSTKQGKWHRKETISNKDHNCVCQVDPLMAQRMSTFVTWAVINGHRGMDGHAEAQRNAM